MNVKIKITMLISLALVGCNSSKPLQQAPQAVQARRIDSQPSLSGTGLRFSAVVTPDTEIMLSFRIPGYVVSLKQVRGQDGRMRDIAEGDRVAQGTVLAQMRATEYEEKVNQAVSQAEATDASVLKAKLDFERAKNLMRPTALRSRSLTLRVRSTTAPRASYGPIRRRPLKRKWHCGIPLWWPHSRVTSSRSHWNSVHM